MLEGIKEEDIANPDAYIFEHLDQDSKSQYKVGLSQGMGNKNDTKWADVCLTNNVFPNLYSTGNYAAFHSPNAAYVACDDEGATTELSTTFTAPQYQ